MGASPPAPNLVANAISSALVSLCLAGGAALWGWRREREGLTALAREHELAQALAQRREAELRLSVLAAEVEPHFLFNTLAGMRSAIATDPARASVTANDEAHVRDNSAFNAHQPVEDQFRVVWPDSQVHWLATRSQTLRDEHGKPVRRIGVNWDITDARNAEALRRERELALHESAAKSRFTARMSHELRTSLNAMMGFAQLLAADETNADAGTRSRLRRLAHIQAAGQQLLTLINDVLDLASLEGGELRIALQPVALARTRPGIGMTAQQQAPA